MLSADARLLDARIAQFDAEHAAAAREIADLDRRRADADARLAEARAALRRTVLLLYQAGPLGGARLVLEAGRTGEMAAAWRLAHELTARQRERTLSVRRLSRELDTLRAAAEARHAAAEELRNAAAGARAQLAGAIAERRSVLASVRDQEAARHQAIEELGRADRELQAAVLGGSAATGVALDVRRFRGVLPMPVAGTVSRAYGDRRDPHFGTVLPHRGWDIDAPANAPVHAVFDGRVAWAAWFRGYGLMVVLDHGGGVHSVYAHLAAITVAKGAEVAKGQLLGTVGDTGSLEGTGLYLEIRAGGKAEDPAAWIKSP